MVICRRLVDLLTEPHPRIQTAILKTIANIMRFDNIQTGIFVNNCSLVLHLKTLLKSPDVAVKHEACECLLVLAGLKGEIQSLIDSGVALLVIQGVASDEDIRSKLVKILKYATRGSSSQVRYLVDNDMINVLCKSLSHFKTYDAILTKVYKYCGPTFNFEFGRDVVVALDNVVNAGEVDIDHRTKSAPVDNKYALAFGLDSIDKLSTLLSSIKENPNKELVDSWRMERPDDSTLEEKVRALLQKLKKVHQSNGARQNPTADVSKHIASMIDETLKKNFPEEKPVATTILVKAVLDQDIRAITVPHNILFADLKAGLEFKFNQPILTLSYLDEEEDKITIDSQEILEKAIQNAGGKSLKIFLQPPADPAKVVGVPETPELAPFVSPSFSRKRVVHSSDSPLPMKKSLLADFEKEAAETNAENAKNVEFDIGEIQKAEKKSLFESLATSTHFGTKELEGLFAKWRQQNKDGEVSKEDFSKGLQSIGITDHLLIEQYFSAFDKDKSGTINFREFVTGLSIVQRGTVDERLKLLFDTYDADGNGSLSPEEVYKLIQATNSAKGVTA
eukprot:TRINITY_DN1744_c0_g1_i12.p1 TRINITY_DN1744_c0_g1~~TRINITY_DN1744_c0_g1_i12.p1  ORF type:complete len:563 (+),score=198.38 TRINITY_DN1744_c0_g1_i12:1357-3045(+)